MPSADAPGRDRLGVGIVGWGSIARTHAQAVEDAGGRLAAVARRRADRPAELADDAAVVAGLDALLARDDVDLVVITTPTGQHADQARRALEAGKHVVVEKPLARHMEDARAVVDAAQRHGRLLSVISQRRFEPAVQEIKKVLDAGVLGRPVLGEALMRWYREPAYYRQAAWRGTVEDDGGALMNQGIHLVDLLRWLMGPVAQVRGATARRVHDIEAEDTAVASLRFDSGALGLLAATTATRPGLPGELNLFFEHGCVGLTEAGITRWEVPGMAQPATGGPGASGAADPAAIGTAGHERQWRDILDAVASQRPPAVDGAAGMAALGLVLAVYEAAHSGQPVRAG